MRSAPSAVAAAGNMSGRHAICRDPPACRDESDIRRRPVAGLDIGECPLRARAQKKRLPLAGFGKMHRPGIEPGSLPWQGSILPLDHRCLKMRAGITSMNRTRSKRISRMRAAACTFFGPHFCAQLPPHMSPLWPSALLACVSVVHYGRTGR